jgi:hypothetical protein
MINPKLMTQMLKLHSQCVDAAIKSDLEARVRRSDFGKKYACIRICGAIFVKLIKENNMRV